MATLYIEEYGSTGTGTNGQSTDTPKDFVANTTVVISETSARTSFDFASATRMVVVYAEVDCFVNFGGSAVTAAQTSRFIPAGTFRGFGIDANDKRISVVAKA